MDFQGKVALVTGGSKGIGRAITLLLAQHGCQVFMNYSQDDDAAQGVVTEAKGYTGAVIPLKGDVTDPTQVTTMMDEAEKKGGKLDILVNNVGMNKDGFLMLMGEGDWEEVLKVNLTSVYHCCRAEVRKRWNRPEDI